MTYLYEAIQPTRLYIKQCSHCGLKYFGKSIRKNIEKYRGSGMRWVKHLKKHKAISIHLWNSDWYYDTSITRFALKFSKLNKIVESDNWANLMIEDGVTGFSSEVSSRMQKNRIKSGNHHLINTVSVINESGEIKIMSVDEYAGQTEFVTLTSNLGYVYRGLDPVKDRKTNAGKKLNVKKESMTYLRGDERTEAQKTASKNHSEVIKKLGIHPTKKGDTLSENHKQALRGPRPNTQKPKPKIECPHCGKVGGQGTMNRWHFNNCLVLTDK
jgi:hypothetical protein